METDEGGTGRPVVVLMCGISGAGKSTYAKELERRGHVRLSIDDVVWAEIGRDAAELDPAEYERHKAAAEEALREELVRQVRAGRSVVLDYSFWDRARRDGYKRLVESLGARWELVYLKADRATLLRRLAARNLLIGPDSVTVSEELLDRHLAGFQEPVGEGERTIVQS